MQRTSHSTTTVRLLLTGAILSGFCSAQVGQPLNQVVITSDFGPRNVKSSWFHGGVDYRATVGTDVFAITNGQVTDKRFLILSSGLNGAYHIKQSGPGTNATRYLHIRCDDPTDCSTTLTPLVSNGDMVTLGMHICDSGTTGTSQPHLHVDIANSSSVRLNPLTFIPYTNSGPPDITIESPMADPMCMNPLSGKVHIKALLDTVNNGLDLNSVRLFLDSTDNSNLISEFTYTPRSANVVPHQTNRDGIDPLTVSGLAKPGRDRFHVYWNTAEKDSTGNQLRFSDGPHELIVTATDAQGMTSEERIPIKLKNKTSIGFVIDDTGSMGDEINAVKASATAFVNSVAADEEAFAEYSLWTFKDFVTFRGTTTDASAFVNLLAGLGATGGDDCPEASGSGLAAAENTLEEQGELLLFTDADPGESDGFLDSVKASLQAKDIRTHCYIFGSCSGLESGGQSESNIQSGSTDPFFQEVSAATGGLFFDISASQVGAALEITSASITEEDTVQITSGSDLAGSEQRSVPVDFTMDRLTVTLTAPNATLTVIRADGATASDGDTDVLYSSSSGSEQYTLIEPASGSAQYVVSGSGDWQVVVETRSQITVRPQGNFNPPAPGLQPVRMAIVGSINDAVGVLYNDTGAEVTTFSIFDDGLHGDLSANDGVFGGNVLFPQTGTYRVGVRGTSDEYLGEVDLDSEAEGEELGGEGEDPVERLSDDVERLGAQTYEVGGSSTVGTPVCLGASCPCDNNDPIAGCANTTGVGAFLQGFGSASLATDDLLLTANNMPSGDFAVLIFGASQTCISFGDGLLGIFPSASNPVGRYPIELVGDSGGLEFGPGLFGYAQSNFGGNLMTGMSVFFQLVYRDHTGPCGQGVNTTNALAITLQ